MKKLNPRQKSFVKHIAIGKNATQSAVLAGYSKRSARFTASKLLTNANILQQLEEIFNKAGLSDEQLVYRLKSAIDAGIGQKATNGDALKGLRMIFDLKNRFPSPQLKAELTQEDEHVMKLENMSNDELIAHMEQTALKTKEVLARMKQRRLEKKNGDDNKIMGTPTVKDPTIESKSNHVDPMIAVPSHQDITVQKAVGILVDAKPIKQQTTKLNNKSELSEDEPYHQKISYPA